MNNQQVIKMKPLLIALSVSVLSGCASGLLPKVSPEAHCKYVNRNNPAAYMACSYEREQGERGYSYNSAPSYEAPLDAETRALMDMGGEQSNQSLVVRDAFYQQDHQHSKHKHNDDLIHDKAKLNSLAAEIQQLQNQLDVSTKHQNEHKQIEIMSVKHQKDW